MRTCTRAISISFGKASLFELLNAARIRIGEETLAAWLKAPAEPPVVLARQDAVVELAPRTDLREDLAVLGEDARTGVHAEALAAWGERPARVGSAGVPVWVWPLSGAGALAVIGLLAWLGSNFGLVQLGADTVAAVRIYVLVVYAVCGSILWRFHARTAAVFRDVEEAAHELAAPRRRAPSSRSGALQGGAAGGTSRRARRRGPAAIAAASRG